MSARQTVAVDVDGVIHSYTSGWQGAEDLPDPPVPGAIEWLNGIVEHYHVAVCSTRAATEDGRAAIWGYLKRHGAGTRLLVDVDIEAGKPPALVYVDDRGWRFDGSNFPTADEIANALPWWKRA
jgi:hypothetical protein